MNLGQKIVLKIDVSIKSLANSRPIKIVGWKIAALLPFIIAVGCAGPSTPFGAVHDWGSLAKMAYDKETDMPLTGPRILFFPENQVLHGPAEFTVIIEDPAGIPENHKLKLSYNSIDITDRFLRRAEKQINDSRQRMKLTTKSLRLRAGLENKIKVSYRRNPSKNASEEKAIVAQYMPPKCNGFQIHANVNHIPDFEVDHNLIKTINDAAREKNFNPYYVAGLIAQESSFDSQAVSRSRAIGLTQVTTPAETEIIDNFKNWPRFPGIENMSAINLKLAIMSGKIHSKNEWRLNPKLSIIGGVEYLKYVADYWSRPEKKAFVQQRVFHSDYAFSDVVLASYNSGALRVSQALERKDGKWLEDDELNEARKYVRRVASFCNYYEHLERQK